MSETLRSMTYQAQAKEAQEQPSDGYVSFLQRVREHISRTHADALADAVSDTQSAQNIRGMITAYVSENGLYMPGLNLDELVDKLYGDMAGLGFLDKYIRDPEVEEINGNAWNDVEIITGNGKVTKLSEHFHSPQNAVDTIQKMARMGGLIMDSSTPVVDSYLTRGIRISAMIPPLVDSDIGAVFSLRRQRLARVDRAQLLDWGTASSQMLDFLQLCVNHGVSVGFAGKTSSGKTTDISWLLGAVKADKRIFTIEETRELDLVRVNDGGSVCNRIIHMKTRYSDNEKHSVDANMALRHSLRFHPDIICVAEMRGAEAMTAQEAARTGHTVVTSLHANSARKAYGRILTMCQMSETSIPSHILMNMVVEAYPVMVFCRQMPDGARRITEIVEATGSWEGDVQATTLFRWTGDEYRLEGNISRELADILLENSADAQAVEGLMNAAVPVEVPPAMQTRRRR